MEKINTAHIVDILGKNWKKLSTVAIITIVLASFFSSPLFIKPKYKSTAIVFPANLVGFSSESNTEQLLQFLNSEEIKQTLTNKFNLYKHYAIDSTEENAKSKLDDEYISNFKISTTLYESIEIDVIDESPKMAQQLCSALIEEGNQLIRQLKFEKVREYINSYSMELVVKQQEIDSIEAKLKYMRVTYGLLDIKEQSKAISKELGKGLSEEQKLLLKGLKEYGGEYTLLQNKLTTETKSYRELKIAYDKNMLDLNGHINYSTIVSKPSLPDKKHSPLRLVIIAIYTLSALLIAALVLLFTAKKES